MTSIPKETPTAPAKPPFRMGLKLLGIALMVGGLTICSALIDSLVRERSSRREEAIREISAKWGDDQVVAGPVLLLPYLSRERVEGAEGKPDRVVTYRRTAVLLPDELKAQGALKTEVRYRGIYEAVLYTADLGLEGAFPAPAPALAGLGVAQADVLWDEAVLSLGVSDTRGVRENVSLAWNGAAHAFGPGAGQGSPFGAGISLKGAPVRQGGKFSLKLGLNGCRSLRFLPLGRQTEVALASPWPGPSFSGEYLPNERSVGPKGFTAAWKVLELARNFPQAWLGGAVSGEQLAKAGFGVDLIQTASAYQQNQRSIAYAVLFILLTFTAFFIFEVMAGLRLHFMHYLLVGSALVVFYLLTLSLSEHIGFGPSYLLASLATVGLVGLYCRGVFPAARLAGLVGGLLGGLYALLYVMLQLEDFALLMGSLTVFAALATVMVLTRKVDWNTLAERKP